MEKEWVGEQKQLHALKILEKIEKGKNQSKYTQKCLQLCKSWNGTATSVYELSCRTIETLINLTWFSSQTCSRSTMSLMMNNYSMSDYVTLLSNSGPVISSWCCSCYCWWRCDSSGEVLCHPNHGRQCWFLVHSLIRETKHRWYAHNGSPYQSTWRVQFEMEIPSEDNLKAQSIIECIIDGEWDVSKERNMT